MILLFVGAGGSAAVDPKQYPTTRGFFEQLPESVTNDSLFLKVLEFLKNQHGQNTPDIEGVLEVLDELQDDCEKMVDSTTITGWAMQGYSSFINGIADYQAFQDSISTLGKLKTGNLSHLIKRLVYEFYAATPRPEQLADWVQLLKGLINIDPALEVFTTNYDRVLENVIGEAEVEIEMGRKSDKIQTRLDTTPWEVLIPPELNGFLGRLTKLHGSVDWQYSKEGISISPVFTGDHKNHCILYPGYKGEPTEDPFRMFHGHLRRTIEGEQLSAAIFVGFAFRDDYINSILANLPPRTFTLFITKSDGKPTTDTPPPRAPRTEHFMHLCGGLTSEAVEICLASIRKFSF